MSEVFQQSADQSGYRRGLMKKRNRPEFTPRAFPENKSDETVGCQVEALVGLEAFITEDGQRV